MKKRKIKTLWEATEAKTSKQIALWLITLVAMVLFSNNIIILWGNFVSNPGLVGIFNLISFLGLRVILGYLFD